MNHSINNLIKKYSTISFDIFDTLLARKVEKPIDIFYAVRAFLLEKEAFLLYPDLLDNFPYLRIEAEKQARAEKINNTRSEECEVLLADIYEHFIRLSHADKKLADIFQETEIFLEKLFSFAPEEGLNLYRQAKSSGKRIIFISDMYLPKNIILDLLTAQGYDVVPDDIFISGELGCSKHTGRLYQKIYEQLHLDKKKWLHIGDNVYADIKQAKKFGISAQTADWSVTHNNFEINQAISKGNSGFIRSITHFLKTKQAKAFIPEEAFSQVGYQVFGPLFFGFICWLAIKFKSEKFDSILFFARDAQLIQALYNKYMQSVVPVNNKYIYVSRAALFNQSYTEWLHAKIPMLYNSRSKQYSIREIIKKSGLIPEQYLKNIYQAGFTGLDDKVITPEDMQKAFLLINHLYANVMEKSAEIRDKYSQYLRDNIDNAKKIAIVDIGWAGNMQASFARANIRQWHQLDISCFYLSFFSHINENLSFYYKPNGWLSAEAINQCLLSGGIEILEFALSADHGSTLGYEIKDNKIVPVLEEASEAETQYRNHAMLMRKGIFKYFSDYQFLLAHFPLSSLIDSTIWIQPFIDLVRSPSAEEAELFGELTHSDTMGETTNRLSLAKKLTKEDYRKNAHAYQDGLAESFWKAGFKKRNQ